MTGAGVLLAVLLALAIRWSGLLGNLWVALLFVLMAVILEGLNQRLPRVGPIITKAVLAVAVALFLWQVVFPNVGTYWPRSQRAESRAQRAQDLELAEQRNPPAQAAKERLQDFCNKMDERQAEWYAADLAEIEARLQGKPIELWTEQERKEEKRRREQVAARERWRVECTKPAFASKPTEQKPTTDSVKSLAWKLIGLGTILLIGGGTLGWFGLGIGKLIAGLGGMIATVGLVWLFFGADIAKAVPVASEEHGRLQPKFLPTAQAMIRPNGVGLVFVKGLPLLRTPSAVEPGQCVRVRVQGAVRPGWHTLSDQQIEFANRQYLDDLRAGRNPILAETTVVVGGTEHQFDPQTLAADICNNTSQAQYVDFKTTGWKGSQDSLTVDITPK